MHSHLDDLLQRCLYSDPSVVVDLTKVAVWIAELQQVPPLSGPLNLDISVSILWGIQALWINNRETAVDVDCLQDILYLKNLLLLQTSTKT